MNCLTHAECSFPTPPPRPKFVLKSLILIMSDSTDLSFPVGCVINNNGNAALTLYIDYEV